MSRRLVQGSSSARRPNNRNRAADVPTLPPYQPLSFPLSDVAHRELSVICGGNDLINSLEVHVGKSLKQLPQAVAAINDRLYAARVDVDARSRRRRNQDTDPTPADERAEASLRSLEAEVPALSRRLEAADRDAIDVKYQLHHLKEALGDAHAAVRAEPRLQPARPGGGGGGGEPTSASRFDDVESVDDLLAATLDPTGSGGGGGDGGPRGPLHLYQELRARRQAEYGALPAAARYAENNDYVSFRRHWHDALHPDEDRPMPDASRWFDADGNPRLGDGSAGREGGSGGGGGGDEEEEEDDELTYGPAVTRVRCPITLMPFEVPYTSRKCKHTFEKSAIISMFRSHGKKDCPEGGCPQKLDLSDFYEDNVMKRKIERAKQREAQAAQDDDDEADEDPDASMIETGAASRGRPVKPEPTR